ncbi:MAG: OmpP1/FadL family transporter [Bacteroidota bacterium]
MKIKFYAAILFLFSLQFIQAQAPEEALRLSWTTQQGTARNLAIGGAMGSLGGDATAAIVNPAGLAFFKTSDFVITPGLQFGKPQSNFRGTDFSGANNNRFQLGTSGFVFGGFGYKAKNSFAITVTRLADFNQSLIYKGKNDYSSFAEPLADEFASSGYTIDAALNSNDVSLTTKMALYTFLVDTATINGTKKVIARSEFPALLNQEHHSQTSGGITEITLAMGHELNKKFMVGGSIGIPIAKIERNTYYRESDASSDGDNDFSYMAYRENYKATGVGFNFKAGLIYRPKEYFRLGLALHSPHILMLKESFDAGMAADLEQLFSPNSGYDSVASSTLTGGLLDDARYTLYTPGKIVISGAYVFREVENVSRQKGFITADIEYVNYKWNRFGPDGDVTEETKAPYEPYNDAIDAIYKSAFNVRLGGELKFKIIMARLGLAYYGSPYKDKELKAGKMNLSGGLGYRNKGIFVDLTYIHRLNKDVNFPYRVSAPRANTFANLKDNGGTALLTVGFKI